MGFELTPRERSWFDAILVLGALALGFIVLGFVGVIFAVFGDLIMVFFLAWLVAFMIGPIVNRVTAIPFMSRIGAIFLVYFLLFGSLVVVSIVAAAALVSSIGDFINNLPELRTNLPAILAPWQARLDGLGLEVAAQPRERGLDLRPVAAGEQVDGLQDRCDRHGLHHTQRPVRTLFR